MPSKLLMTVTGNQLTQLINLQETGQLQNLGISIGGYISDDSNVVINGQKITQDDLNNMGGLDTSGDMSYSQTCEDGVCTICKNGHCEEHKTQGGATSGLYVSYLAILALTYISFQ